MAIRNQPVELEPLNPRKRERHPAPTEKGDMLHDGFQRLKQADARTGIRQPIGGTNVYPPYHEDM